MCSRRSGPPRGAAGAHAARPNVLSELRFTVRRRGDELHGWAPVVPARDEVLSVLATTRTFGRHPGT
jgi:hypothetical protein